MEKKNFLKYAAFACILGTMATACSDDNTAPSNGGGGEEGGGETITPTAMQYAITAADTTKGTMKGGVTLKVMTDLTKSVTDLDAYNDEASTHSDDYFTQVGYNAESKTFTGFVYGRGATSAELNGTAGIRSYKVENGKMIELGSPIKVENGGHIGTFGAYTYVTQISAPTFYKLTRTGDNVTSDTINWNSSNMEIDGTLPGVTGTEDLGDNSLIVALKYGNRDSVAIAFTDYSLSTPTVITDDRIGATGGATRSVRYSMIGNDDEGNTYVFCGTSATDSKIGALRIKKGTKEFDKDYKFDILTASGGYRFRSAVHITGDYFLLQCYNATGTVANLSAANKLAVINVKTQDFKWVTGISGDLSKMDMGWPDVYGGIIYQPVNMGDGFSGGGGGGRPQSRAAATGIIPTVYSINPTTAVATPLVTMLFNQPVKAFTILK